MTAVEEPTDKTDCGGEQHEDEPRCARIGRETCKSVPPNSACALQRAILYFRYEQCITRAAATDMTLLWMQFIAHKVNKTRKHCFRPREKSNAGHRHSSLVEGIFAASKRTLMTASVLDFDE